MHQINNAIIKEPDMKREYHTNQYINRQSKPKAEKNIRIIEDKIKYKKEGYAQEVHLPMPYPFHQP
jgi:hypothetical protein